MMTDTQTGSGAGVGTAVCKVLVIDDNRDAAEMLRDFLEIAGHQVALAFTGTDGVEKARSFTPDVVLCDISLPAMSGHEVAAVLRKDPKTKGARLIALSGYAGPSDRARSSEAGFDLHLAKPVDPDELMKIIGC